MDDQILDIVPVKTGIYVPDVGMALNAWHAYQKLVTQLLDDSDYAIIGQTRHRKRSGWAKLRRAFSITTHIIEQEWESFDDGSFGYRVTVRALFPDGRFEDGDGYCDSTEFVGRGRIAATRHNVRSKAITRAKNRATADLIGTGEVSAEEMIDDDYTSVSHIVRRDTKAKKSNGGNGRMTLDEARARKTPNNTPFGELNLEQLQVIIDTYPGTQHAVAAQLVKAHKESEMMPEDEQPPIDIESI